MTESTANKISRCGIFYLMPMISQRIFPQEEKERSSLFLHADKQLKIMMLIIWNMILNRFQATSNVIFKTKSSHKGVKYTRTTEVMNRISRQRSKKIKVTK